MDGEEKKDVAASFHYPQYTNTLVFCCCLPGWRVVLGGRGG